MNRLILVGNGFDLAHGMKTSYKDFISWYITRAIKNAGNKEGYNDELLQITRDFRSTFPNGITLTDYIQHYHKIGLDKITENYVQLPPGTSFNNPYRVAIKSKLLQELFSKCKDNSWVDIENEFYEQLKLILNDNKYQHEQRRPTYLTELNNSLSLIIELLEKYLEEIVDTYQTINYHSILKSPVFVKDLVKPSFKIDIQPQRNLVLNFNYTSTIENYLKYLKPLDFKLNHIHGKIGDESNPIIFGFGDELDKDYEKMELEKTKGFLNYIKSFWYFRSSNYHNLIRFIEDDEYQVFVLGHSLGLSDRTMLSMIFEHTNCKSIKIFYHEHSKGNNYVELTQEISKHFKNKLEMRRKIVPFDKSEPMPQAKS